jgi:hypothetical protein
VWLGSFVISSGNITAVYNWTYAYGSAIWTGYSCASSGTSNSRIENLTISGGHITAACNGTGSYTYGSGIGTGYTYAYVGTSNSSVENITISGEYLTAVRNWTGNDTYGSGIV